MAKSHKPTKWLRIQDLADHLRISRSWIYKRTMDGEIPHRRAGSVILFDVQEVDEWIRSQPPRRKKRNGGRR